mgnify:CR=1 FL=1
MLQYLDKALTDCETLATHPDPTAVSQDWLGACQTVGNILLGMGLVEESQNWQRMSLDFEPDTVRFYAASGWLYIRCEAWEKASYFYERMIEYQPDNADIYCRLAKIYNQLGDYKSESETLHTLLSQQPEMAAAEGHHQLAKVLEEHGLSDQAIACYEQAIASEPEATLSYYALSELLIKQGQSQRAIELLAQLTQQIPDDATAHYRLGRVYRQAGQYETAILSFRQALKFDADLHWAYMGLLNSLLQLSRWDETIESCRGIIHFVGEFPWAYCFLGNALAKKGELAEAAKSHQKAFELRGWERCAEREYEFSHTWFSENISLWERHLLPLNEPDERSPIAVLSLGSSDGSSLCWLVDEILRCAGDRLVCITEGASQQLQQNLAKLPESDKVSLEIGPLQPLLEPFADAEFDVIYIQSDRKQGNYLNTLATQAWQALKPGGLMFFKDYQWRDETDPAQSSKPGIDAFIQSVSSQVQILHQSHQMILKKVVQEITVQEITVQEDVKEEDALHA